MQSDAGNLGAVGKAITVLDAVTLTDDPVTLSEIGRRSGLPKATVHRILAVLEVHGMVQRCYGGYRLGRRPTQWVDRATAASSLDLQQEAMPFLSELHRGAGLATGLVVLAGDAVVPVYRLHDRRQLMEIAPLAQATPLHCTATGKVLLAFDPVAADRCLAKPAFKAYTDRTIICPQAFVKVLASTREEGIGRASGELQAGLSALAAPIADRSRRTVAAVAVAGPCERVETVTVARLLRLAAAEISVALREAQQRSVHLNGW